MVRIRAMKKEKKQNDTAETAGEETEETRERRALRPRKSSPRIPDVPEYLCKHRWSDKEKLILLSALNRNGYTKYNLKEIAAEIPGRTPLEVAHCIRYWRKVAYVESIKATRDAKLKSRKRNIVLVKKVRPQQDSNLKDFLFNTEEWIDYFIKLLPKAHNNCDETHGIYALSNIFLVIAQFEAHPEPEEADGLDFRELYLWMHELMNGNPLKKLSAKMFQFIIETFSEIIDTTHSTNMVSQMTYANHIANQINFLDSLKPTKIKTYNRVKKDEGCDDNNTLMEQIVNVQHLNPLKIQVDERIKKPFDLCKKE